ncbi:LysR family transcriptional regulator [bacterium]|nr:MAG: LysR family transcriptional regulator [bacterium]
MNFRHIEYFLAVAEDLNFSRAAKRLRLSQPPLSKSIQQLEKELGIQLFLRDKRSVQLTAAGKAYRERILPIFDLLDQARLAGQMAQAGRTGELRVGFLSPLFYNAVPNLLLQYRQQSPDVQVNIIDMMPRAQIESLMESKIDVAFPGLFVPTLGSQLESKVLWRSSWQVCLHATHALATRQKLSLQELRFEDFVFIQRPLSPAIREAIFHLFELAGYQPQVAQGCWCRAKHLPGNGEPLCFRRARLYSFNRRVAAVRTLDGMESGPDVSRSPFVSGFHGASSQLTSSRYLNCTFFFEDAVRYFLS